MLESWRRRAPDVFKFHHQFLNILTLDQKNQLAELLTATKCSSPDRDIDLIFTYLDKALRSNVSFDNSINTLSECASNNRLSDTLEILNNSPDRFDATTSAKCIGLAKILANPLCGAIFDARLRIASDYAESHDPMKSADTVSRLLHSLFPIANPLRIESQIEGFFHFFYRLRLMPPMQETEDAFGSENVLNGARIALTSYCDKCIERIEDPISYNQAVTNIWEIQTSGAAANLAVKYQVAAYIVNNDWYDRQSFSELMNTAETALKTPGLVTLEQFRDKLLAKKALYFRPEVSLFFDAEASGAPHTLRRTQSESVYNRK